ncbi:hypothetical protein Pmani_004431 [Petrolisthes manimaculis]|uniref:Uncharacterized protein n=1 Tax=Petrolisthes manimaculis TaxID=1843537 RepID=A0AAE1QGF2_9EUCA|nr:hypothetical protein Pmani_004431 [Petrolisthes manimaculis]
MSTLTVTSIPASSTTTRCHPPPMTLTTALSSYHPSIHPSTIHHPQLNAIYNLASSITCHHPSLPPSLVLVTIHPASVPDPNLWDHPGWLAGWLACKHTESSLYLHD